MHFYCLTKLWIEDIRKPADDECKFDGSFFRETDCQLFLRFKEMDNAQNFAFSEIRVGKM